MSDSSPDSEPTLQQSPGGVARVDPPHQVQDFTLTSDQGEPISLSDLHGRSVLMFFGYTHCPEECPTTLAGFKRVKQTLGDDANDVAFVFISVDGKRDTPEVMNAYLDNFDPDFIGMTGDEALLREVGAEYGLMFQQEATTIDQQHEEGDDHEHDDELDQENYFVQHTSPSFLIDPDGYLRYVYFYGTDPDAIANSIQQTLQ